MRASLKKDCWAKASVLQSRESRYSAAQQSSPSLFFLFFLIPSVMQVKCMFDMPTSCRASRARIPLLFVLKKEGIPCKRRGVHEKGIPLGI